MNKTLCKLGYLEIILHLNYMHLKAISSIREKFSFLHKSIIKEDKQLGGRWQDTPILQRRTRAAL